jgi:hypothetical protein
MGVRRFHRWNRNINLNQDLQNQVNCSGLHLLSPGPDVMTRPWWQMRSAQEDEKTAREISASPEVGDQHLHVLRRLFFSHHNKVNISPLMTGS